MLDDGARFLTRGMAKGGAIMGARSFSRGVTGRGVIFLNESDDSMRAVMRGTTRGATRRGVLLLKEGDDGAEALTRGATKGGVTWAEVDGEREGNEDDEDDEDTTEGADGALSILIDF